MRVWAALEKVTVDRICRTGQERSVALMSYNIGSRRGSQEAALAVRCGDGGREEGKEMRSDVV